MAREVDRGVLKGVRGDIVVRAQGSGGGGGGVGTGETAPGSWAPIAAMRQTAAGAAAGRRQGGPTTVWARGRGRAGAWARPGSTSGRAGGGRWAGPPGWGAAAAPRTGARARWRG